MAKGLVVCSGMTIPQGGITCIRMIGRPVLALFLAKARQDYDAHGTVSIAT